jgi:hypothetical protein
MALTTSADRATTDRDADPRGGDETLDLEAVAAEVGRTRPDVPGSAVRAAVDRAARAFRDATIATYLPVLIARRARLHLRLEWPPAAGARPAPTTALGATTTGSTATASSG